jgi:hypothetical protein
VGFFRTKQSVNSYGKQSHQYELNELNEQLLDKVIEHRKDQNILFRSAMLTGNV